MHYGYLLALYLDNLWSTSLSDAPAVEPLGCPFKNFGVLTHHQAYLETIASQRRFFSRWVFTITSSLIQPNHVYYPFL